ncbi:MAG: hypothetical protein IKQ40_04780 [Lachnospiraceae bacterium]|nr:hypothetical protein [Lachnospiraceae bacterium]
MLKELFGELYTYHRQLAGSGAILVLFPAALLLLAASRRKWIPLILSPLTAIAAAVTQIIETVFAKKERKALEWARAEEEKTSVRMFTGIFTVCLLAFAIILSGEGLIFGDMVTHKYNDMHIPGDLDAAMSGILDDSDSPRVLTMPGWGVYFKSYSSAFDMMYDDPYGDDLSFDDEDKWTAYTQLSVLHPDMKKVASAAKRSGCTYVVLSNDIWPEVPVTDFGYETFIKGDMFTVYREVAGP